MKREQARILLADSLKRDLLQTEEAALATFEQEHPDFKKEADLVREQWTALSGMKQESAPESVSDNFYQMLDEVAQLSGSTSIEMRRKSLPWWQRKLTLQWIGAASLLVVGFFVGRTSIGTGSELDSLKREVAYLDKMFTLTMLEQSSASKRLAAVERTGARLSSDPELSTVLLETLRYDPNVNVRLAALHALNSGERVNRDLRLQVWNAARNQDSPLVTATLIELWAASPDPTTRDTFEALLSENPDSLLEPQIRRAIESLEN